MARPAGSDWSVAGMPLSSTRSDSPQRGQGTSVERTRSLLCTSARLLVTWSCYLVTSTGRPRVWNRHDGGSSGPLEEPWRPSHYVDGRASMEGAAREVGPVSMIANGSHTSHASPPDTRRDGGVRRGSYR